MSAHGFTAGQADPECADRMLAGTAAGRVFVVELRPEPVRHAAEDRGLEEDYRNVCTQRPGILSPSRELAARVGAVEAEVRA